MIRNTIIGISMVVVASVALAATLMVYSIRQTITGAELWSSADEAYLLVGTNRAGWNRSALGSVRDRIISAVGFVPEPLEIHPGIVLFKLTATETEKHVIKDQLLGSLGMFEGELYMSYQGWFRLTGEFSSLASLPSAPSRPTLIGRQVDLKTPCVIAGRLGEEAAP